MEFTESQVAGLVLGYLRSNKYSAAADELVKGCSYLHEKYKNSKIKRCYSVTRVTGMCLVDFLEEYAAIYTIVQAHLENSNYYDEVSTHCNLVDQIAYLLDKEMPPVESSTPEYSNLNGIDAETGNRVSEYWDDPSTPKPARRTRSRSKENDNLRDVSEVLTKSLLESHELHEKIAETINIVRSTPEAAKVDDSIGVGASKELDAIIKTVVQRTEVDPVYNKLIDEIIGSGPIDQPVKTSEAPSSDVTEPAAVTATVDEHNNEAIRSIIEASQKSEVPLQQPQNDNNNVYLFDGTLDTYLKTGVANTMPTNPVYFNTGGLIVVPEQKQFYFVNNQPLINVAAVKNVITDTDIMSMPTIIVNEETQPPPTLLTTVNNVQMPIRKKRQKLIAPKITKELTNDVSDFLSMPKKRRNCKIKDTVEEPTKTEAQAETAQAPVTPRAASHVRNLDFTTPHKSEVEMVCDGGKMIKSTWDAELRALTINCADRSPPPRKKRGGVASAKKKSKGDEFEARLKTPEKEEVVPQTPGAGIRDAALSCTPFEDVLEEHLKGVDLISMPTPKLPITPGFALTPADGVYKHRSTDYSTSSSYYQPSDTEGNKSLEELMDECKTMDSGVNKDGGAVVPGKADETVSTLKILNNVVIERGKIKPTNKTKQNFNNSIIGKKNLNLINRILETSSSDESDDESDSTKSDEQSNKTVIFKNNTEKKINDIIKTCEVDDTFDEKKKRQSKILSDLEVVRKRTIKLIKNPEPVKARGRRGAPRKVQPKLVKTPKKRGRRKKDEMVKPPPLPQQLDEDEEAQKLVKGLAQRGIHLVPNKTPPKPKEPEPLEFDRKTYDDFIVVVHDAGAVPKKQSYDLAVLSKKMKARVFIEDNEEITRIIAATAFASLYENATMYGEEEENLDDDLMDYVFLDDGSPDKASGKTGRKRKPRTSEDGGKQTEKKNKTYENHIKLLKKVNVDDFLDRVHSS